MSLTISQGPLAAGRPAAVNYEIDGPPHLLFMEAFPRRVRAMLGGRTVLDTRDGKLLHETNLMPRLYVPDSDFDENLLEASSHTSHCPFKGVASYWSVRAGDRVSEDAVWSYPEPLEKASWLIGHRSVYWDKMDAWLDEDEEVKGHLRDPYHRVDVRRSSRHVIVRLRDEVVAETTQPRLLSETGLPNRFYVPPADVREGVLEPSPTGAVCPYKGEASYWSVRAGSQLAVDAAWSYPAPLESALAVADHMCFRHADLSVEVDGEPID